MIDTLPRYDADTNTLTVAGDYVFTRAIFIRRANEALGQSWFSTDTMRFFSCRVSAEVYQGVMFVTSEKPPYGPRAYTVRVTDAEGRIDTVGEFGGYATRLDAIRAAKSVTVVRV